MAQHGTPSKKARRRSKVAVTLLLKDTASKAFDERAGAKTWPRGVWRRATEDTAVNADVLRRLVADFDHVDDAHDALDNRPRLGSHKKAVGIEASRGRLVHKYDFK